MESVGDLARPAGETTPHGAQIKEFTELQRLLKQEKEKKQVLEESSKLEQMRIELEVLCLHNAELEKWDPCAPQDQLEGKQPPRKISMRSHPSLQKLTSSWHIWMIGVARTVRMTTILKRKLLEVGGTPSNQGKPVN